VSPLLRVREASLRRRLVAILLPSAALYALLAAWFWLPALLPRGRVTIGTMTNREAAGALLLLAIGGALYGLYLAGAALLWRGSADRSIRLMVWGGAIVITLLLIGIYPVTSSDIFDYIFRGRMALRYDANPYLVVPNRFRADPYFRYVGWPNAPSAYGPLWERLSVALQTLGSESLLRNVVLIKALAAATHLAIGLVIGGLVRDPQRRIMSQYLWLWCPLALWELPAIGHNDGLLILSLLLALWVIRRQRHWLTVLALTAGALLKFLPAILLPLVALDWMRHQTTWPARLRVAALAGCLSLVPAVALYAPYWDVPPAFADLRLTEQIDAVRAGATTTLRNLAVRASFLHATPMALASYVAQTPAAMSQWQRLMALPSLTAEDVRTVMSRFSTLLLAMGIVWQCWQVWFRRRDLRIAFAELCLWYLVTGLWFQPWYLLWLLALLILDPHARTLVPLWAWMITAQASYLLQFIMLPRLGISGQSLAAQSIYLIWIYALPIVAWIVLRRHEPSAAAQDDSHAHTSARKSSTT
jgi:hypothetical protein